MNAKHAKLVRKLAFRICVQRGIDPNLRQYVAVTRRVYSRAEGKTIDRQYIMHDPLTRMGVYRALKRRIRRNMDVLREAA